LFEPWHPVARLPLQTLVVEIETGWGGALVEFLEKFAALLKEIEKE